MKSIRVTPGYSTCRHPALGIVAALYQRNTTGRGQKVLAPMQDAVLNLCRVKLRDQQRLERTHTLHEYPQYPDGKFGNAVPRAGNASGGGQPGSILKCKGWETDPNAYIYFTIQGQAWAPICDAIGKPEQQCRAVLWSGARPALERRVGRGAKEITWSAIALPLLEVVRDARGVAEQFANGDAAAGVDAALARLADAIVEVTETGSTIRANNLRIVCDLMSSVPVMIANRNAWSDLNKK